MSPVTSEPIRFVYSFFLNNFGPTETVSGPDVLIQYSPSLWGVDKNVIKSGAGKPVATL